MHLFLLSMIATYRLDQKIRKRATSPPAPLSHNPKITAQYNPQKKKPNMLPHPHPIHSNMPPCIRMRQKVAFLILTTTAKEPKTENQTGKEQKHGGREFKRPHPHKENKTEIEIQLPTPLSQKSPYWQYFY